MNFLGPKLLCFFTILALVLSCNDDPLPDVAPQLSYTGISKTEMFQGAINSDTLYIFLEFSDGNGDIGGQNSKNIIVIDKRTDERYDSFSLPDLPQSKDGVNGQIVVRLFTTCCIFPENIPPCEAPSAFPVNELLLEIHLRDEAGNESNRVLTDPITLLCQ